MPVCWLVPRVIMFDGHIIFARIFQKIVKTSKTLLITGCRYIPSNYRYASHMERFEIYMKGETVKSYERSSTKNSEFSIISYWFASVPHNKNEAALQIYGLECHFFRLFVSGGFTTKRKDTVTATVEMLDLRNAYAEWEKCASMREARGDHAMIAFNNQLFVFGGWNGTNTLTSCER